MMKWDWTLFRVLLQRELGSRLWLTFGIAAVLGVVAARGAASAPAVESGPIGWMRNFGSTAAVVLSLIACVRLLQRPAEDHGSGWLHAYCGNTARRATYAGALGSAVVLSCLGVFFAAVIAFLAASPLFGRPVTNVVVLVTGPVVIIAGACYGLLLGLLVRSFATAFSLAVLGFAIPVSVLLAYVLSTDREVSETTRRLATAHLPHFSTAFEMLAVLQNVGYIVVIGLILWHFSHTLVARHE